MPPPTSYIPKFNLSKPIASTIGGYGGGGGGPFGSAPGPIANPNPFSDLSSIYPNLSGTNAATSQAIMSKLSGQLSPATIASIQDAGARFGITSGMGPGSGLQWNKTLRDIGLTSEEVQNQGLQAYSSVIPAISKTQTVSPELQAEIADRNSVYAAAPDPAAAQSYAETLFNKYLGSSGGGGGSGDAPWWQASGIPGYLPPGSRQTGPNSWWSPAGPV